MRAAGARVAIEAVLKLVLSVQAEPVHAFRDFHAPLSTTSGSTASTSRRSPRYGFDSIELFATRSHFDYHDRAISSLGGWLNETGLDAAQRARADHRQNVGGIVGDDVFHGLARNRRRQTAIQEAEAALAIARRIPFDVFVVHLGTPESRQQRRRQQSRGRARSVEEICRMPSRSAFASPLEVIPNDLSTAGRW